MTAARLRYLPLAVMVPISLVMLFSPGSTVPSGPPNSDKLVHALLFAALAAAATLAGFLRLHTAVGLLAYAAVSEVLQQALPIHRSGSPWDFAADAVGVAIGLGVAAGIGVAIASGSWRGHDHE